MTSLYLITGAAGHLGSTIARQLVAQGKTVRGFDLNSAQNMPDGVERYDGNITDPDSLTNFLARPNENTKLIVIHCAGLVTIVSHNDPRVYAVNVLGTKTVLTAAIEAGVDKYVQVSSVHAIPEQPSGQTITEVKDFDPARVIGLYAKTKAEASHYVMETATAAGLDFTIVHPSGLVGPYDDGHGHISALVIDYCCGKLTSGVKGGYDFADVRDVATGVIAAAEKGESGECYILSNQYFQVKDLLDLTSQITHRKPIRNYLPIWFVKLTAPLSELYYKLRKVPPLYTSYSIYTLESNSSFSHDKATRELGYTTRPMRETLRDTIGWFREIGKIA